MAAISIMGTILPKNPNVIDSHLKEKDSEKTQTVIQKSLEIVKTQSTENIISGKPTYTTQQVEEWLFNGNKDQHFPRSTLATKQHGRMQGSSAPKISFSHVPMLGEGEYTSRIAIYNGSVTDISAEKGQRAAVGDSNNGDLLTGCGFAVATAIINAAGPNLQRDLYNQYGVPGIMQVPEYGQKKYAHTEGRGYAIPCEAHDMRKTHNIERVEYMTVPMNNIEGVRNMYAEAFAQSKDLDFIVMPMAGMSHPVLEGKPELSAKIATEEFRKFVDKYPDSKLKVVFSIYKNETNISLYTKAAIDLDHLDKAGLDHKHEIGSKGVSSSKSKSINSSKHAVFTTEQIEDWLFKGKKDPHFPQSILALKQKGRKQDVYAPKISFSHVHMIGTGKHTSRIAIYSGGITDIAAEKGQRGTIADSNNGDLLTGSGYGVSTAIINATGPNLQRDLYNTFGVPQALAISDYGKKYYSETDGRGYAIPCDAHDMRKTHNIECVEYMVVPTHSVEGLRNMYAEAFAQSKDRDFIVVPMAGMHLPVLEGKPELSAKIATEEFQKFVAKYPDSQLKVVFSIYKDMNSISLYTKAVKALDE